MKVKIITGPCIECNQHSMLTIEATDEQLDAYENGTKNIQSIFPELSPEVRELLVTGTHPECWKKMWEEED